MFYCPLHNWYSSEEPCKACHPIQTFDTSTVTYPHRELASAIDSYNKFYWKKRCELAEKILEVTPSDPNITNEQIAAHKEWSDFKKRNQ